MILVALLIGIILIVAAVRNSQGALFDALYQDVPGFVVWGAALFAIGAIGFIPDLKPVSRGLLILVIVVIVLHNYQKIIQGFQNLWQNPPAAETLSNSTLSNSTLSQITAPASAATGAASSIMQNNLSGRFDPTQPLVQGFGANG